MTTTQEPTGQRPDTDAAHHADAEGVAPELETMGWYLHAEDARKATLWTILKRLPYLAGRALRTAWQASRWSTALAVGLNVVAGVATTFGLLATRGAAEALFTSGPTWDRLTAAMPALMWVGTALAVRAGLGIAAGYAQSRLEPVVTNVVEAEFFQATTALPLRAYDSDAVADDMQRSRDRGMMAVPGLVRYTIDVITGLVGVVAVAVAVAIIHPVLVVLLVVAVLPVGWAAITAARIQYLSWQTRITRRRRLWMLEELMASRRTAAEMRAYGIAGWLLGQHKTMVAVETAADLEVLRKQTTTRIWGSTAGGVATLGVYGALAWLLAIGQVPLAAGAAAVLALQQGAASMRLLVASINTLYDEGLYFCDHITFMESIHEYHTDSTGTGQREATEVAAPSLIALEGVSLRYDDTDTDAVTDIHLEIRHGQTIALVGENGSGKSTLAKLIACLYRPTAGRITWDGTDTATCDPAFLRQHLGVVMQDFHRWPFSARTNIRIGRHEPDPGGYTVEEAARAADAHHMITDLPRGYDTLLDKLFKGGVELSGGQWQRLAAARGFYRDSPILICDEPSAALDPKAEAALFAHLKKRAGAATTILITHRLANVRHADHIIVLDKGRIIETGSHDTLMAAQGSYAHLFGLQASGYTAEPSTIPAPR